MPLPIFPPAATVETGPSLVPPRPAEHVGSRTRRPGQRIIAGRVFYSAAWLDQAISTGTDPLSGMLARVDAPDARYAGRGFASNRRLGTEYLERD